MCLKKVQFMLDLKKHDEICMCLGSICCTCCDFGRSLTFARKIDIGAVTHNKVHQDIELKRRSNDMVTNIILDRCRSFVF